MKKLDALISRLPKQHKDALMWFNDHCGTNQPWPRNLPDGTLLATKAKGIYKPKWSEYALSVRQSLNSPYHDRVPDFREDGTWSYLYFQENSNPAERDNAYTNRGLIRCLEDSVPIGVIRQTSAIGIHRYDIIGLAIVAAWEEGYFRLEGFSKQRISWG